MMKQAANDEEARRNVAESIPLKRWGAPEDLAGTILFLCSRAGAYVTGAILPLDGGAAVKS